MLIAYVVMLCLAPLLIRIQGSQVGTHMTQDQASSDVLLLMDTIYNHYTPQCLRVQMLLDRPSGNHTSNQKPFRYSIPKRHSWINVSLPGIIFDDLLSSKDHPSIVINLKSIQQTKDVVNYINKHIMKLSDTACVSYMFPKPPDSRLMPSLTDPEYGKRVTRYFLVHTQNSTEAEQFLLYHHLQKEENVAALIQEEGHNSSYWRVLIRQLLHPSGSPQVLTVNRWSRDTGLTSTENIFPEQMANFHGRQLRGATLRFMPFVGLQITEGSFVVQLKPCTDLYLLNMIAQKLNFTYKIVMPEDMNWGGRKEDGHFHGIVGDVEVGRANFSLLLSRTEDRATAVDFTRVYIQDPLTFITAKSLPSSPWRKILTPFRTSVWLCVLVSVVGGSLLYHVIYHAQATLTSSHLLSSHAFMHVLASSLSQSIHNYLWLQAGKVFLGFWFLYAFLVTSYYTTFLTSTLAVPFATPAINTLLQLYQSDYQYGMKPKTSQHQYFASSDIDLYKNMIKRMSFYSNYENIRRAAEGNFAFISFKRFLSFHVAVHNSNPSRSNDLRIATEEFYPGGFAWAVPKGAPYRRGFNAVMLRAVEAGLIGKWFADLPPYYVREASKQQTPEERQRILEELQKKTSRQVVFNLNHLQGPFFMLFLGYILGVLILGLEILSYKG